MHEVVFSSVTRWNKNVKIPRVRNENIKNKKKKKGGWYDDFYYHRSLLSRLSINFYHLLRLPCCGNTLSSCCWPIVDRFSHRVDFYYYVKWNNIMAKRKGRRWRGEGERRAPSQLVNRRIKFNWQTAMSGKTGSKDLCQAVRVPSYQFAKPHEKCVPVSRPSV